MAGRRPGSKGASKEDFMLTLYQLCEGGMPDARLVDVASELDVSRAAATKMAARLKSAGLVSQTRYGKVAPTRKGLDFASRMAWRHRIVEVFLHGTLGMSGKELEDQAHELEHAITPATLERLDRFLGRPSKCPHGMKIARRSGAGKKKK